MSILTGWGNVHLSQFDKWLVGLAILTSAAAVVTRLSAYSAEKDYEPGDQFAILSGLDTSQSSATLVIFLNSNCGASERSGDVFSRIARLPRSFRVVVVGYEGQDLLKPFVRTLAIDSDSVVTAPVGSIRFAQVPQIALLDRGGIVRSVWSGAKDITGMEGDILSAARSLADQPVR